MTYGATSCLIYPFRVTPCDFEVGGPGSIVVEGEKGAMALDASNLNLKAMMTARE